MNKIFFTIFVLIAANASADSIRVQCRGPGASSDRFIYDAIVNTSVNDNGGTFSLNADGRGPGGQYDIGNRFQGLEYNSYLKKDDRGRPLSIDINGALLPGNRSIELVLDLTRPNTQAELEFMREDGNSVFARINCTTSLPQSCRTIEKCRKHCHPMVGCDYICRDETTCTPGKFASEN